jgi:lipid-binding SYLF domain-containing protein
MKKCLAVAAVALLVCVALPAVAGDKAAQRQDKREAINAMAQQALVDLFEKNERSRELYKQSAGYAVFDNLKFAFILSGGGGVGVAVDRGSSEHTYMKMATGGIGLGVGGQSYQVIIFFEDAQTYRRFVDKGWAAETSANAVAGGSGKNFESNFTNGMVVYQMTHKGLMAQADIAGTKFWKNKKLNAN